MNINDVPDLRWYADTGATANMTHDVGTLTSFTPYSEKDKIFLGDGAGLIYHVLVTLPCLLYHLQFI